MKLLVVRLHDVSIDGRVRSGIEARQLLDGTETPEKITATIMRAIESWDQEHAGQTAPKV